DSNCWSTDSSGNWVF
nr:immunoglobulin light chain junction region [Macaca mulatta]